MIDTVRRASRRAGHLVRRFVRALPRREPDPAVEAVGIAELTPAERALWARLPAHDRRHALEAAADVDVHLAGTPYASDPRWREAALLHDVGKEAADLGVVGRALATVIASAVGSRRVERWARERAGTLRVRIAQYARHGEIGADWIRDAGGSDVAAAWAGAHHADPSHWHALGIPAEVVVALDAADWE